MVLLPVTVIALFVVDWRLGLVSLVVLPPTLVVTRWFQTVSASAQLDVRNRIAAVTAQIAESVAGMASIQAFNRERAFQEQFDELNEREPRVERLRPEAVLGLLPLDRVAGRDLDLHRAAASAPACSTRARSRSAR